MDSLQSHSIDLSHSFDLNGTENDEMLRLYLRKAGCSDKIEYLTPEQRKAFIYDIIKSNKMPGFWVPSTMRTTVLPPPQTAPTPPMQTLHTQQISQPIYDSQTNPSLRSSASNNSLKSLQQNSSHVPQRFAPATPPSPTAIARGMKGSKPEISGPTNFRHLDGDMTRDMTRNAFDLSVDASDNVLKKYMMERDITEQDLTGMRKRDIIRNIVHSRFTWKPNKKKEQTPAEPELKYATISTNYEITPPQTPAEYAEPAAPPTPAVSQKNFSNFNLVTARFQDPSLFPNPDEIFGQTTVSGTASMTPQYIRVAPTPFQSQTTSTAPPPPSTIQASNYNRSYSRTDSMYATLPRQKEPTVSIPNESIYATVKPKRQDKPLRVHIPMPPPDRNSELQYGSNRSLVPPPTPPKPVSKTGVFNTFPMANAQTEPAQSVHRYEPRAATNQNFNSNSSVPMPPPPPPPAMSIDKSASIPPPPPPQPPAVMSSAVNVPMPPPPPPPMVSANGGPPIPPPPPMVSAGGGPPMPPPPPMPKNTSVPTRLPTAANAQPTAGGDPRDALLESIRNGVALRKVDKQGNKKAATISGIKPRPERKPQPVDFLSELKMGITLRRVKNPADNPYAQAEPHESDA